MRVDDPAKVVVKIELEMVEGINFPPTFAPISDQDVIESAIDSYIAWVDLWCKTDKAVLRDHVQAKLILRKEKIENGSNAKTNTQAHLSGVNN